MLLHSPRGGPWGAGDGEAAHGHTAWEERTEGLAGSCKRTHEKSKSVQGPQSQRGLRERLCVDRKEEWVRVCRALREAGWSRALGQEGPACTEAQSLQGQAQLRACWSTSSRACVACWAQITLGLAHCAEGVRLGFQMVRELAGVSRHESK